MLLSLQREGANLNGGTESQHGRSVSCVECGSTVVSTGFKEKLRGPVLVDDNLD